MTHAYEQAVGRLRERLVEDLRDRIESIILYGSVAKNRTHEDSDIDILVVTRNNDRKLYGRISKIRTKIDLDSNTLTTLVQMSREELERYVKLGSPFMESVVQEGIILYDRGLFQKVRGGLAPKG